MATNNKVVEPLTPSIHINVYLHIITIFYSYLWQENPMHFSSTMTNSRNKTRFEQCFPVGILNKTRFEQCFPVGILNKTRFEQCFHVGILNKTRVEQCFPVGILNKTRFEQCFLSESCNLLTFNKYVV